MMRLFALQAQNLLTCTEAGIRAALMRKESRGFHLRLDYPQVDNDRWAVRIIEEQGENGMMLNEKKPDATKIPVPGGKEANIGEFIIHQKLKFKNSNF
jgi:succinate dehydrogenase / fumarate reductase flavoprotein subunit